MAYLLRVIEGKREGEILRLEDGTTITIGRGKENILRLDDRKLSREHCQIECSGGKCTATDLNSTNGTMVNGTMIEHCEIVPGDEIVIGLNKFLLEEEPGEAAEPAPEKAETKKCAECGRKLAPEDLASPHVRRVGDRYYCEKCAIWPGEPPAAARPATQKAEAKPELPKPKAGDQFGSNKIVELIGEGKYGLVYKAEHVGMKRPIALKVLTAGDEGWAREFVQQVYEGGRLVHPNIVLIYDIGEQDGVFYVSMEYVAGTVLREKLDQAGSLPPKDACSIATQVAHALAHGAEQGMAHGRISPKRIFLGPRGVVKVSSFGLVRAETSASGKPDFDLQELPYRPPEQLRGPVPPEFAADAYALGAVLYHMLAGQPPFVGETVEEVRDKIFEEEPQPLSVVSPGGPATAQRIIDRALAKSPLSRYQTPKELLWDLEEVLGREV